MAKGGQQAYCTLLMTDDYLPGAMVLAHSLRDHGTKKQLAVLVTLDSLQASTIDELQRIYDHIIPVSRITNKTTTNLRTMNRLDLVSTFTKIALWRQTQFEHIVYLDADVLAIKAPDELFDLGARFAGVPDIGWPDCFNSGVLSLKPNIGDYYALLALAQRGISFDGADQGLLNTYFHDWHRLSFTYNCTPSGNYQYVPAYRYFESSIKLVHYIGDSKPWIVGRHKGASTAVYEELLGRWWSVYDRHYKASMNPYGYQPLRQNSMTEQSHVKTDNLNVVYEHSRGVSEEAHRDLEIPNAATEKLLTESILLDVDNHSKDVRSSSRIEQRSYSAAWNPRHQSPPKNSRPEASSFPSQIYNMSEDANLFQAPIDYPEPPKNLNYEVPSASLILERPKPIFPWEKKQVKPTRVFPNDPPLSSSQEIPQESPQSAAPPSSTSDQNQPEITSPLTPTIAVSSPQPFTSFSRTNAWDDVPEIEHYIQNLPQNRRRKNQGISNSSIGESPGLKELPLQGRRPSIKLTDFPTEIERPSLPVTPAPIHRPSFWGEERNAAGDLPSAEGVPEQSDWNPTTRLAELRQQQSEVLAQGPSSSAHAIPDRELVGPIPTATTSEEPTLRPSFRQINYSNANAPKNRDDEPTHTSVNSIE